jgi:hypothetical protein
MVTKRKKISISKYNKIMEKIIAKGLPVPETLIELLEEASKYDLIDDRKKK